MVELKELAGKMTAEKIELLKERYQEGETEMGGSPDIRKMKRRAQIK